MIWPRGKKKRLWFSRHRFKPDGGRQLIRSDAKWGAWVSVDDKRFRQIDDPWVEGARIYVDIPAEHMRGDIITIRVALKNTGEGTVWRAQLVELQNWKETDDAELG